MPLRYPLLRLLLLLVLLCAAASLSQAASVTLAWDPNSEPDVAGYRLYYGTPSGNFGTVVNTGNVTNYTVSDLHPGATYGFYVTCYNTSGLESEPSNIVEYNVPSSGTNTAPVGLPQFLQIPAGESVEILLQGSDAEYDALTFNVVELPVQGTIESYPPRVRYTAPAQYTGPDPFWFAAHDGFVESEPALIDILVLPPNQAPTATPLNLSTLEDEPLSVVLSGTDPEGAALSFWIVEEPLHGVLEGEPPYLTYWPEPGYVGPDSFSFHAADGWADSAPARVDIEVLTGNQAPVVTVNPTLEVTLPGQAYLRGSATDDGLPLDGPGILLTWYQVDGPGTASITDLDTGIARAGFATPGTYWFRLLADDGHSSGWADVEVTVRELPFQPGDNASTVFREAESGTLTTPMAVETNAPSGGGSLVTFTTTTRSNRGLLTVDFDTTEPGDYIVWCRVLTRSGSTDSFFVAVDGGPEDIFDASGEEFGLDWKWMLVSGRGDTNAPYEFANAVSPLVFPLPAGAHQITFRGREVGTHLDAIVITRDPQYDPALADAADTPPRLALSRADGSEWELSWQAIPGRRYQLLAKTSLEEAWAADGATLQALTTSMRFAVPAGSGQRFYALELLPR